MNIEMGFAIGFGIICVLQFLVLGDEVRDRARRKPQVRLLFDAAFGRLVGDFQRTCAKERPLSPGSAVPFRKDAEILLQLFWCLPDIDIDDRKAHLEQTLRNIIAISRSAELGGRIETEN